jgi:DNA-directed RNA polymerase specialized sigma24 family protein
VFWLRHAENLSIGEIAQRVKKSNDAVRSSLYRVKRMLIQAVDPALATVS